MGANDGGTVVDAGSVEVIGLNGATLVACGTSLPIVRRKSDGLICRLVVGTVPQWLPESEFDRYLSEGRVSRLESAVPLLSSGGDGPPDQPLVLFANTDVLKAAGVALPSDWPGAADTWTTVLGEAVTTWATCLPGNLAKQWLNDWASRLRDKIDDALARPRTDVEPGRSTLLQWADLGLCAATAKPLRWQLYLRYGAAMEPDRVRRTFDTFVQREFPKCSWEFYLKEMTDLTDVVRAQPRPFHVNPAHVVPHLNLPPTTEGVERAMLRLNLHRHFPFPSATLWRTPFPDTENEFSFANDDICKLLGRYASAGMNVADIEASDMAMLLRDDALLHLQRVAEKCWPNRDVVVSLISPSPGQGIPIELDCHYSELMFLQHRRGGVLPTVPINGSVAGMAFRDARFRFVPDATQMQESFDPTLFRWMEEHSRSIVVWPLRLDSGIVGVLQIDAPEPNLFEDNPATRTLLERMSGLLLLSISASLAIIRSVNSRTLVHQYLDEPADRPQDDQ